MLTIPEVLTRYKTIAVVGLSSRPERPSHGVALYMQSHGYRIVPVNPSYAGTQIHGEHCYDTLTQASQALKKEGTGIEIVDCFRQSEMIDPIVDEAITIGAKCVWMQLGVVNEAAAEKARNAGLTVIMDRCIKIEHAHL